MPLHMWAIWWRAGGPMASLGWPIAAWVCVCAGGNVLAMPWVMWAIWWRVGGPMASFGLVVCAIGAECRSSASWASAGQMVANRSGNCRLCCSSALARMWQCHYTCGQFAGELVARWRHWVCCPIALWVCVCVGGNVLAMPWDMWAIWWRAGGPIA